MADTPRGGPSPVRTVPVVERACRQFLALNALMATDPYYHALFLLATEEMPSQLRAHLWPLRPQHHDALTASQEGSIVYSKFREDRRASAPSSRSCLHHKAVTALTGPARGRQERSSALSACVWQCRPRGVCEPSCTSALRVRATPEGPQQDPAAGWLFFCRDERSSCAEAVSISLCGSCAPL
jgi:hypothetical protein